jgi:aminoglycoside/choline kinase family phosphotransferase
MQWAPELRDKVRDWVGPVLAVEDRSWPHGVTRVYRVTASTGTAFVKVHSQVRKFRQEVGAYREWGAALGSGGVLVASLIGADEGLCALALTDLGGVAPDPTDPHVHAQAGAALAVLHGIPFVDPDPMPTRVAVLARLQRWATEARGVVPDDVVARVVTEVGDASVFDGGRRVPCHRDFSPRNWMIRDGRFGLIDFEHAAPDIRWVDFSKLAEDAWRDRAAKRAFVDAYGRPWSELDAARFRCLIWLQALSTWVWSVAHRDAAYEAQARDLYARLAAGYEPLALD